MGGKTFAAAKFLYYESAFPLRNNPEQAGRPVIDKISLNISFYIFDSTSSKMSICSINEESRN